MSNTSLLLLLVPFPCTFGCREFDPGVEYALPTDFPDDGAFLLLRYAVGVRNDDDDDESILP